MSSSLHLFGELLRSLKGRPLRALAVAGLSLTLFLAVLTLFLLLWSGLGEGEEGEVLALLDAELIPSQIDQLYLEILRWEEVARVQFIFAEEVKAGLVQLGTRDLEADLFQIGLRDAREAASVQERLRELGGISRLIAHEPGYLNEIFRSIAGMRAVSLALLIVLGLLALAGIRSAIRALIISWKGELQLLHLAGVARRTMGGPFILLAVLLGLAGALLIVLGLYIAHTWGMGNMEVIYRFLPALGNSTVVLSLALSSVGVGMGLGGLGGAWSLLTLRRMLTH